MKLLKLAGAALVVSIAAAAVAIPASAQDAQPAQPAQPAARQLTLDQVLSAVRRERSESSAENRAREERFLRERNNQQAELNRVRGQVNAAEAEATRLEGVMAANQEEIDKLDQELRQAGRIPGTLRRRAFGRR